MRRRSANTLNFTKAGVESLKPPETGRAYTYDERLPGLALCVTAAGTKTFYLVRRVARKVEFIRLGGWPEVTVEQARKLAAQHNGDIASGINPNDAKRAARNAATLGSVFDQFVEMPTRTKAKRPKGERTKHEYKLLFKQHLEGWRDRPLDSIAKPDIEALHNGIGKTTPYAANRTLALLQSIFNTAIDLELISSSPAARIRPFEESSRVRRLHVDELPKFWAAIEAEPSEKIRDFVKLALLTGQRKSDVLAMKWADLQLDRGLWIIPHTKTGRHEVPLSVTAIEILRRRKAAGDGSEYVLPGRHGRGHLIDPMRAWARIVAAAGLEDLRIHDLRRSMGSFQTDAGASRAIVGKLLGHKREETTAIYGRLSMTPVRASLESATAAIIAAATPAKPKRKKKQDT